MDTRNQTNFISLLAAIGVVFFHLAGSSKFYIGNSYIPAEVIFSFYQENSLILLAIRMIQGATAYVGVFFILSGYGLSKQIAKYSSTSSFYSNRIIKIYIYSLVSAVFCSIIVCIIDHKIIYGYWSSFIPLYGFYEFRRDWYVVQYWYLALLFIYYLIFPLLLNNKQIHLSTFILTIVMCMVLHWLLSISAPTFYNVTLYHSVIFRFPEFLLGIFICKNRVFENFVFKQSNITAFWGILLFAFGYISLYIYEIHYLCYIFTSVGALIILAQIFYPICSYRIVLNSINLLSGGSFTLYLTHIVIIGYIIKYCDIFISDSFHYSSHIKYLSQLFIIFIMSLLILLIGRFVERIYAEKTKYFIQ